MMRKLTKEQIEKAKVRLKAKDFAKTIPINMALRVPDDILDSLTDADYLIFKETLYKLKFRQRPDGYWERL